MCSRHFGRCPTGCCTCSPSGHGSGTSPVGFSSYACILTHALDHSTLSARCSGSNPKPQTLNPKPQTLNPATASERLRQHGRRKAVVGDLVCTDESDGRGGGWGDQRMNVTHVTPEDVEQGKYTIRDVVLPLGGKGVQMNYPKNAAGDWMRSKLTQEGLVGRVVDIAGDVVEHAPCLYRHLIVRPTGFSHKVPRPSLQPLLSWNLGQTEMIIRLSGFSHESPTIHESPTNHSRFLPRISPCLVHSPGVEVWR